MESSIDFEMQCLVLERERGEIMVLAVLTAFQTEDGMYLVGFEVDVDEHDLDVKGDFEEDRPLLEFEVDFDNLAFDLYPCFLKSGKLILRDFKGDKEREKVQEYYQNNVVLSVIDNMASSLANKLN